MTGRTHPLILWHLLTAVAEFVLLVSSLAAADTKPQRVPWTTSRIQGSPEPARPYVAKQIHEALTFREVTEIVFDPVSKCWLILERAGKIHSLLNNGAAAEATLVADLKALHPDLDNLYGFAFHPKFAENRQVFITYTAGAGKDDGTKLSRFTFLPTASREPEPSDSSGARKLAEGNPKGSTGGGWQPRQIAGGNPKGEAGEPNQTENLGDEQVILTWRSGGHNGAHLQFGPDGFLYISTGDAEVPSPPDPLNTGQDITDLLSSILRIDVDHKDPGLEYAIPKDNPFLQTPKACPEIWAYGFRNPWKMSFDRATGRLWCGDVGWELWEMIHLVERGGNYGWSAMEASQPIRADAPKAPTPILPPIAAHSHDEAASITGGYVYHGRKFPELEGAYIYGDWETGKIWALWYDGKQVTRREEIADTPHKIITFAQDSDGEIIYAHYGPQGTLHTLERNPDAGKGSAFPRKLTDTGLFKDAAKFIPADGVYRLDIKHQMWEDSARAVTWLALPEHGQIITKVEKKRGKDPALLWPKDSVLARTVSLPTTIQGKGYNYARVETQVLHFDGSVWNAYTYQWREDQKDGDLVPAAGGYCKVAMTNWLDRKTETVVERRLHSRAECMRCHNSWTGGPLSITPAQLNTEVVTGDPPPMPRQIDDLVSLGLIDSEFINASSVVLSQRGSPGVFVLNPDAAKTDPASVNERARSYLHVNCSQCHRKNAGGAVTMMLNAELPAEEMRAVDVVPQQGGLGLANPKLIDPGNPWNSVICVRLAKTGIGHMPVIGPRGVDEHGLRQVEDWIAQMRGEVKSASDLLPKEWSESLLREKLSTVEGAMQVRRAIDDNLLKNPLRQSALEIAWKSPQPTVRDIFERFKPDDLREATIGLNPDLTKLLAMPGDVKRGASILSLQGKLATCYACHIINGTGLDFGPDLSKVGARLKREQMLESMLHPSKVITQGYAAVSAEMKDGAVQSGFIVKDGAHDITLKTATGQSVTLMKSDIKSRTTLPISLMPEGQLQSLTSQETADVLTYLESLK